MFRGVLFCCYLYLKERVGEKKVGGRPLFRASSDHKSHSVRIETPEIKDSRIDSRISTILKNKYGLSWFAQQFQGTFLSGKRFFQRPVVLPGKQQQQESTSHTVLTNNKHRPNKLHSSSCLARGYWGYDEDGGPTSYVECQDRRHRSQIMRDGERFFTEERPEPIHGRLIPKRRKLRKSKREKPFLKSEVGSLDALLHHKSTPTTEEFNNSKFNFSLPTSLPHKSPLRYKSLRDKDLNSLLDSHPTSPSYKSPKNKDLDPLLNPLLDPLLDPLLSYNLYHKFGLIDLLLPAPPVPGSTLVRAYSVLLEDPEMNLHDDPSPADERANDINNNNHSDNGDGDLGEKRKDSATAESLEVNIQGADATTTATTATTEASGLVAVGHLHVNLGHLHLAQEQGSESLGPKQEDVSSGGIGSDGDVEMSEQGEEEEKRKESGLRAENEDDEESDTDQPPFYYDEVLRILENYNKSSENDNAEILEERAATRTLEMDTSEADHSLYGEGDLPPESPTKRQKLMHPEHTPSPSAWLSGDGAASPPLLSPSGSPQLHPLELMDNPDDDAPIYETPACERSNNVESTYEIPRNEGFPKIGGRSRLQEKNTLSLIKAKVVSAIDMVENMDRHVDQVQFDLKGKPQLPATVRWYGPNDLEDFDPEQEQNDVDGIEQLLSMEPDSLLSQQERSEYLNRAQEKAACFEYWSHWHLGQYALEKLEKEENSDDIEDFAAPISKGKEVVERRLRSRPRYRAFLARGPNRSQLRMEIGEQILSSTYSNDGNDSNYSDYWNNNNSSGKEYEDSSDSHDPEPTVPHIEGDDIELVRNTDFIDAMNAILYLDRDLKIRFHELPIYEITRMQLEVNEKGRILRLFKDYRLYMINFFTWQARNRGRTTKIHHPNSLIRANPINPLLHEDDKRYLDSIAVSFGDLQYIRRHFERLVELKSILKNDDNRGHWLFASQLELIYLKTRLREMYIEINRQVHKCKATLSLSRLLKSPLQEDAKSLLAQYQCAIKEFEEHFSTDPLIEDQPLVSQDDYDQAQGQIETGFATTIQECAEENKDDDDFSVERIENIEELQESNRHQDVISHSSTNPTSLPSGSQQEKNIQTSDQGSCQSDKPIVVYAVTRDANESLRLVPLRRNSSLLDDIPIRSGEEVQKTEVRFPIDDDDDDDDSISDYADSSSSMPQESDAEYIERRGQVLAEIGFTSVILPGEAEEVGGEEEEEEEEEAPME